MNEPTAHQIKVRDRRFRQLRSIMRNVFSNRRRRKALQRRAAASVGVVIGELRRMERE